MAVSDNICKYLSKNLFLLTELRYYVESEAHKNKNKIPSAPAPTYKLCIYCLEWLNSLYRRAAKLILPDQHLSTPPYLKDFLQRAPYSMGQITWFYHFLVSTYLTRVLLFLVAQPGTRSYTKLKTFSSLYSLKIYVPESLHSTLSSVCMHVVLM